MLEWFASLSIREVIAWNSLMSSAALCFLLFYLALKPKYRLAAPEFLQPRGMPLLVGFGLGMSSVWLVLGFWFENLVLREWFALGAGVLGTGLSAWFTHHFKEIVNKLS